MSRSTKNPLRPLLEEEREQLIHPGRVLIARKGQADFDRAAFSRSSCSSESEVLSTVA
jgi:hypothetical protein